MPQTIKIILITLFACLALAAANSASASTINAPGNFLSLNSGLVGYWTLDGGDLIQNVKDISGNGNNGSMQGFGATSTAVVSGKLGQGLKFDGVDDYATTTTITLTGVFTLSFWMNIPNNNSTINMAFGANGTTIKFGKGVSANSFFVRVINSGSSDNTISLPSVNTWHHIILKRDSSNKVDLIVDNGIVNRLFSNVAQSGNFTLDKIGVAEGNYWLGKLDDIRIYSRALSASEITQLYNTGSARINQSAFDAKSNLQSGLVGWWTMDGADLIQNVKDKSGLGNNGALKFGTLGNISTSSMVTTGKLGQGLKFDGVDDYVDAGAGTSLNITGDITVSVWLKKNVNGTNMFILDKKKTVSDFDEPWRLGFNSNSLLFQMGGGGTTWNSWTIGTINDTNWHQVVITIAGTTGQGYKDGNIFGTSKTFTGTRQSSNNSLIFGNLGGTNYLNGSLDDVRIYNRALSAGEVKQLYNTGSARINQSAFDAKSNLQSGLVGWWTMDGADLIQNVKDKSGLGNNGSLQFGTLGNISTTSMVTTGKLGQGLKFDGVDDYVQTPIGNGLDPSVSPQTYSTWVKSNDPTGSHMIFGTPTGTNNRFYIGHTVNKWDMGIQSSSWAPTNSVTIATSNWTNVVLVMTGSVAKLYVNGVFSFSKNYTSYLLGSNYVIGNNVSGGANYNWNGSIDDVRVYSRALSASEIKQLYMTGK